MLVTIVWKLTIQDNEAVVVSVDLDQMLDLYGDLTLREWRSVDILLQSHPGDPPHLPIRLDDFCQDHIG